MNKYNVVVIEDLNKKEYFVSDFLRADIDKDSIDEILFAIMSSYFINEIEPNNENVNPNEYMKNVNIGLSDDLELTIPEYYKDYDENQIDNVVYAVIHKTKDDVDLVGLYVNEFEAMTTTHKYISNNDEELFENKSYYYKRLFYPMFKNINGQLLKYNFEKMQFDV